MKKLIVLLVLMFFAKPVFPILDFVINYEAIQERCENKNKPELECNGSCHLKKELAKTAEDTSPFANDKKGSTSPSFEILFFESQNFHLNPVFVSAITHQISSYADTSYNYLAADKLLRPPLV